MNGCQQFTQSGRSTLSLASGDRLGRLLNLPHQSTGDAGIDRTFGVEKPIDVRRTHVQRFSDVRDGRLLIPDLTEKPFSRDEYLLPRVDFRQDCNVTHIGLFVSVFVIWPRHQPESSLASAPERARRMKRSSHGQALRVVYDTT